jgi:hypothetical protein
MSQILQQLTPSSTQGAGVVERESVRIWFFVAGLNDMEMCMGDIGNGYPHSLTKAKVFAIAPSCFGDDEGCVAFLIQALYGLKTSGAAWHAYFSDTRLYGLGYWPLAVLTTLMSG